MRKVELTEEEHGQLVRALGDALDAYSLAMERLRETPLPIGAHTAASTELGRLRRKADRLLAKVALTKEETE